MNTRRTKPLNPLFGGNWARVRLSMLLLCVLAAFGAQAQDKAEGTAEPPRDQNSELRTNTWSIFAQGGVSWANGVWYQNIDAKRSYKQSPAVGGGFDFTIRPWVRIGADYLWSRYRREQRPSVLDTKVTDVKAYGNYMMNTHNVKLNLGFNFMELWPKRGAQWLNIWIGTGLGHTFARGNEYSISYSNTITSGGTTKPFYGDGTINNDGTVIVTGHLRSVNRHESYNKLFIPTTLHIEADLSRRFTVGVKGEIDWLLSRKEVAPKNLIYALATVRYNFVASKASVQRAYYEGELSQLNQRVNALRDEASAEKANANREAALRQQAEKRNDELKRALDDCERSKTTVAETAPKHYVQFAHNSSYLSKEEVIRLREFARSVKGERLGILAEASTPGTPDYNQAISERRLARVVAILLKEGFAKEDLRPQNAIGAQGGKSTAEGRRVTITVEK